MAIRVTIAKNPVVVLCSAALCLLASAFHAEAQHITVNSTAFCKEIVANNCEGLIPSGEVVEMSHLAMKDGKRVIYFWGSIKVPPSNGPEDIPIAFNFAREG
ncbi:MAG: hypothetical protein GDA49_10545 [Rhodospirillales bacterium]|nr:hypothetical protein [Rhodospirillales bacterium]